MNKIVIIASLLLTFNLMFGQENVGIGTTTPEPSAILDISSSDRGILIPRTDTSAINTYLASVGTAETGLMIFQTSDASFYFFNGSKWEKIGGSATALIDNDKDTQIKLVESFQDRLEYYLDGVKHYEMKKNLSGSVTMEVLNNNKNIGIGKRALINNSTGPSNVGLGDEALSQNTTGSLNTAIGTEALINNQTGEQNVALGYESLFNSNGNLNTSIGVLSLSANTTGSGNVALGFQSGANETGSNKLYIENSSGDSSQALIYGDFAADSLRINGKLNINGAYALPSTRGNDGQSLVLQSNGILDWETNSTLVDADGDTKIDLEASPDNDEITFDIKGETKLIIKENTNGITTFSLNNNNFNTVFGEGAGKDLVSTSSGSNTLIGRFAGAKVSDGVQNIFVGGSAGDKSNGSRNIMIGVNAGADNRDGNANIFIGNRAGLSELGSSKLYIESSSGDSSQALIYGDFAADSLRINGKLNINGAYSFPNSSGFSGQSLVLQANGSLDWETPSSTIDALITSSNFIGNSIKLHQYGLGPDTVSIDISNVVAAGLDLNGEEINKGLGMRYFIYVQPGGAFPNQVANNPNDVLGEVKLFAGTQADLGGWLPCEGQLLDPADYTALFSIIGTQYGGDGNTTFALPDLRNAVPVHN